jgi:formylglycine-generating enzyme required for sulfatase activity
MKNNFPLFNNLKKACFTIILCFIMSLSYSIYSGFCPDEMVKVEIFDKDKRFFCIDKFEYPNQLNKYPMVQVTLWQAKNICLNEGKRLCTTHEWNAACHGPGDMKFFYGNDYIKEKCNTDKGWTNRYEAAPSGSYTGCFNSHRDSELYDMIGNVSEWTDSSDENINNRHMIKGGYWAYGSRASCDSGIYLEPDYKLIFVGFRCCMK